MASNKSPEATSVFDTKEEDGVQNGQCPFIVHGLFGQDVVTPTSEEVKLLALQYYKNNSKNLSVG